MITPRLTYRLFNNIVSTNNWHSINNLSIAKLYNISILSIGKGFHLNNYQQLNDISDTLLIIYWYYNELHLYFMVTLVDIITTLYRYYNEIYRPLSNFLSTF